jgi:aromatic-L-amino-acid decarboxylase
VEGESRVIGHASQDNNDEKERRRQAQGRPTTNRFTPWPPGKMSFSFTQKQSSTTLSLTVPTFTLPLALATTLALYLYKTLSRKAAPPHKYLAQSDQDFNQWGQALLRWISDYRTNCRDLPVISTVSPNYLQDALPSTAPNSPEDWSLIMSDLDSKILPGLTNWEASNKFFAYFKPHASYPAVLGELLCAGLNVMGFDWIASPACTELEVVVLDWLAKFLNLPEKFLSSSEGPGGGVIQGSAGESAIVVLLAALIKKENQLAKAPITPSAPKDRKKTHLTHSDSDHWPPVAGPCRHKMVVYCADQAHAIIQKATMVLGCIFRAIDTSDTDLRLTGSALEAAIAKDVAMGFIPIAIVATTGTTSSCVFDPLPEIVEVAKKHNVWLHIDAAYGGAYACLPELSDKFEGLEGADSYVVNCHKKLMCPFDIAALYVANRRPILDALSLQPEYLRNAHSESGAVVDYEHWQMPLGRRFRAMKLWFDMRRFGTEGLREHVRNGTRLAKRFAAKVEADEDLEIASPTSLSLVCFRWKGRGEEDQKLLLEAVKATGDCFIIHTKLRGKIVLRLACGGLEQSEADVDYAFDVIKGVAQKLK